MKRPLLMNCLVACAFAAATAIADATEAPVTTPVPGDPAHGKTLYQACQACHSIDDNDLGPKYRAALSRQTQAAFTRQGPLVRSQYRPPSKILYLRAIAKLRRAPYGSSKISSGGFQWISMDCERTRAPSPRRLNGSTRCWLRSFGVRFTRDLTTRSSGPIAPSPSRPSPVWYSRG
jgi:hypothetical protein